MAAKVLIIEDDKFIASLITQKLKEAGFDIELALDAEEGLKKIEARIPDILLLDLILPGIDGFEVLKKLKKDERTKHMPIIILSNLGGRDDVDKGIIMGADAYLIKSNIMPQDVIKKIQEVLKS